jgi:polyhydroxyalkanoate synthesis regulator phasin
MAIKDIGFLTRPLGYSAGGPIDIIGPQYESGILDTPADRSDVKDQTKKFSMPKAPGDKFVRQVANLIIGKNPAVKIGKMLVTEYGDDVVRLGKQYKDDIFNAVFSKIDDIDFRTPQELAKTFIELGISKKPATMTDAMKGQYWRNASTELGKISKKENVNSIASENYKTLTKEAMAESGAKTAKEIPIEKILLGSAKGTQTSRLKNINEYYPNLQKEMLDNNLTIDEAITKIAGRDLPRSTKSYQIVTKFYNLADEMKEINPNLYKFFDDEIKAYQIGNFTGRKIKHGTKEYEAARVELAKKLNIDIKDIDRAHSIMAPRLNKLSKLVDEGTISVEEAKRLSKPQYFLLNKDNLEHVKLENKLDTLLQRKKSQLDVKEFTSANKTQEGIEEVTKQMEKLGVESELFDPVKKLIKVFGRRPDTVELYKKAKQTGINKKDGGMMSIFDMIQPIDAQR